MQIRIGQFANRGRNMTELRTNLSLKPARPYDNEPDSFQPVVAQRHLRRMRPGRVPAAIAAQSRVAGESA